MRLRLLSAAVGLPLIALAVGLGGYWLAVPAALVAGVAAVEMHTLLDIIDCRTFLRWGVVWAALIVISATQGPEAALLAMGAGVAAFTLLAIVRCLRGLRGGAVRSLIGSVQSLIAMIGGTWYVALPMAALVLLRDADSGLAWLAVAFLATFATDTIAYFVGSSIGKRRLAPSISPSKTWEGSIGGVLGGFATTVALIFIFDQIVSDPVAAVALGLGIPITAQAGDMLESWLKRKAGAKDSSALIPGHGGVLDRLDSLALVLLLVFAAAHVWPA